MLTRQYAFNNKSSSKKQPFLVNFLFSFVTKKKKLKLNPARLAF